MENIKKILTAEITKGEGDKQDLFLFVISDGLIDRHGDSVNPMGWDFSEFNDNPVCLIGHDYGSLPIGKWLPPFVENDQVKAYLDLADTERGREARFLIENGYLKTVSVGFRVQEWGKDGDAYVIMKQLLYEVSLVSIPANTRAQRVKDARALSALENLDKSMETTDEKKEEEKDDVKYIKVSVEALKGVVEDVVGNALKRLLEQFNPVATETKVQETTPAEPSVKEKADTMAMGVYEMLKKHDQEIGLALRDIKKVLPIKN